MGRLGFCGTGGWKGWERLILRENPCLGRADVLGSSISGTIPQIIDIGYLGTIPR
jgi:hypothetical protein